jgi:sugar phosphate isomerase/epimerase
VERILAELKAAGIRSIEIRNLLRSADERSYQDVIQLIWDAGLELTVHGHVAGSYEGTRFTDIYPSMNYILQHFHKYQSGINMTLHAFEAKEGSREQLHSRTVGLLQEWSGMIEAESLPLQFALEINRRKPKKIDPGDSLDEVLAMVNEVGSPRVGICWDMGHSYSNLLTQCGLDERDPPGDHVEELPPLSFLQKTVHTHIHGLGATGTHHPLTARPSLPLERYVASLVQLGYTGVYNMEFTFSKFDGEKSVCDYVRTSIHRLAAAVAQASCPPAS